jgi:membrane protease YdiL (CAAX protease family)
MTMPFGDRVAAGLRGFGPLGLLAMLVVLSGNLIVAPLSAVLALLWARASRTPWHELGFVRPPSWIASVALGIVSGAAFKFLMKAIVMPLLGAPPLNQAYRHLVGNRAALPGMLLAVTIGAGFGEETVFRGYLFERLGKLLGSGALARASIVLLTAGWFAVAHYPEQGVPGVQQAAITGLVFGAIFAVTGRLWTLIFAHAAFDVTAVAIIYWDLESKVAHLVFS